MTAVHNPAPLSTTAPMSSIPSPTVVTRPKRERNSPSQENMLHDLGASIQSLPSHPSSSNQSYQHSNIIQQANPFSYQQQIYQQQSISANHQPGHQLPHLGQNQQSHNHQGNLSAPQVSLPSSSHLQTSQQQSSSNTLQPVSVNQSHSIVSQQHPSNSTSLPSHKPQIGGNLNQTNGQSLSVSHQPNGYHSGQQNQTSLPIHHQNVTQVSGQMLNQRPPQLPQPQLSQQQRAVHQQSQSQQLQPLSSQTHGNRMQQTHSRAFTTHTQMIPPSLPALGTQISHGFSYPQQHVQMHQSHPPQHVMLPALGQTHFKPGDEAEMSDDLMGFPGLQSNRLQDISSALVSNAFQPEHISNANDPSVMEALIQADPESDPLNMNVHLQMSLNMDPQRSIERQVLPHNDRDPNAQNHAMNQATTALPGGNATFSMQLPNAMPPLPYTGQGGAIPHPQVLLQGPNSFSAFPMQTTSKSGNDGSSMMMIARQGLRGHQSQPVLQMAQQDDLHRRQVFGGSNQMSIQDLTKPKTEHQDAHFSPASPSYSAVTISPPTLLQTSQGIPKTVAGVVPPSQANGESPTSVTTPPGLSCHICKTRFTRRYNLKVHMTSKHSDKRDFQCDQCPNAFNRVDSLKRHIATTHRKEKKWSCEVCHKNFGQRPHMKMHIDTVHLKKRDHICHCGKAFGTRYNLNAHQRTHLQTPKKHLCLVCKKSFALKSSLARHQRNASHTPPPDVQQAVQQHAQQQMNSQQIGATMAHDQGGAPNTTQQPVTAHGPQLHVSEQTSVQQAGNTTELTPGTTVPVVSGVTSAIPLARLPRLSN